MEFLSKTDLYDAQGRDYNYWSDGTIRDIAEHAPNAVRRGAAAARLRLRERHPRAEPRRFRQVRRAHVGRAVGIGARMRLSAAAGT